MSKIETGRWSDQLRRMLGMAGSPVVAAELSPEISPTIQLEGPSAEWAFLKGVRLAASGLAITAAAGTGSTVRLRNPLNSACIAVITAIGLSADSIQDFQIRLGQTDVNFGGVLLSTVRDSRWGQVGATGRNALIVSATNTLPPAVGEDISRWRGAAGITVYYPSEIVLAPGDNLDMGGRTANIPMQVNLAWAERGLPELEG